MTTEVTDTITRRVARGVALLDERLPGWVERIDLDRLDLRSPCNCILGQEFADAPAKYAGDTGFDAAADALFAPGSYADDLAEYGFEEYSDEPEDGGYDALTAEWKRVITARRLDRMTTAAR